MTSKLRRAFGSAAVAALIGFSLFTASAPVNAEVSAQDTCARGEVCVYRGDTLIASSEGNLSGTYGPWAEGGTVRNNGYAYPGADHIRYTVTRANGTSYTVCLHYPGDDTPTTGSIPPNGRASNIRWGGDC
jgi:hypothetical protein